MISCKKQLFKIPDNITYLNCSYLSPNLETIAQAGISGIMRKSYPWEIYPHDFFTQSEQLKQLFANIIHTQAQNIAIVPSVSYAIAIAAKNIEISSQQNIVLLEEQFPSNVYPWLEIAQQKNANIVTVKRPSDHDWTSQILKAIDQNTAVVSLANCHWTDGSFIDLQKIGDVCRHQKIPLVIDATQSLGVFPFDIEKIQPAFVVTAGYKWLLGPYGLGFMYIAPQYQNSSPLEENWINRKNSNNFSQLVNYTSEYAPRAQRFDMGERSNFILLPMAIAALEQITTWGVHNIYQTVKSTVDEMIALIHRDHLPQRYQFEIIPQHLRCGHILGLRFSKPLPDNLGTKMKQQNIYVSIRSNVIRISPYLYNNSRDSEQFIRVFKQIIEES